MPIASSSNARIAIIGLGYVGLPLAVALSRRYATVGFDVDSARVAELKEGLDRTREVAESDLRAATFALSDDAEAISGSDVFIVTVPTPVDDEHRPDLAAVLSACRAVGRFLRQGSVVVFESTVYPGVTENVCGPEMEAVSGLRCGRDFFLGYSPERVNPGDREHTVGSIAKVVAGQTPEVTALLIEVYGAVTSGGVFAARDIKTAEAAKVIENAQRDINIAFINEVTQIFHKLGISVFDVLEAASTKWNFLEFQPGLVGGHCIGVDPYYLAHRAQEVGHEPEIILAGRRINDGMGAYVAARIATALAEALGPGEAAEVLVLGLTFKEDVPDLRNTKVIDIVRGLEERGHRVRVHDPMADAAEARKYYGVDLLSDLESARDHDCIVGAVAHGGYRAFTPATFSRLLRPGGLVADVKGMWRHLPLPDGLRRWQL